MATIFYSMAGVGRGHAARAITLAQELCKRHRVVLYAPGEAHSFVEGVFADTAVEVRTLPCPVFAYNAHGSVHYPKTLVGNWTYLRGFRGLVRLLSAEIERDGADLVLADFEPAMARAARRCGVPWATLDHQGIFVHCRFPGIGWRLRMFVLSMRLFIRLYMGRADHGLICSFFCPPLRHHGARIVGALIRPDIVGMQPGRDDCLLVYTTQALHGILLPVLRQIDQRCRLYGFLREGEAARTEGNLELQPISKTAFTRDLQNCRAIIATAGNQLCSEAVYLGKPLLAIPLPSQYEQYINAHYLQQMGAGQTCPAERFSADVVRNFLARLDSFRGPGRDTIFGNDRAIAEIEAILGSVGARP